MRATNKQLLCGVAILLLLAFTAFGQQAQTPAKAPDAPSPNVIADSGKTPEIKPETAVRILKLQRQQRDIEIEAQRALAAIRAKQSEGRAVQAQLEAAIREAFKEAGADDNKFTFNLDALKFEPKKPDDPPKQ